MQTGRFPNTGSCAGFPTPASGNEKNKRVKESPSRRPGHANTCNAIPPDAVTDHLISSAQISSFQISSVQPFPAPIPFHATVTSVRQDSAPQGGGARSISPLTLFNHATQHPRLCAPPCPAPAVRQRHTEQRRQHPPRGGARSTPEPCQGLPQLGRTPGPALTPEQISLA